MNPLILMILDGYGLSKDDPYNAVRNADTPNLARLFQTHPHSQLLASGPDVGLPEGVMGNSEVGHLNIGAGRVIDQDLQRINKCIANDALSARPALETIARAKPKRLHLMGLLSDGGVHSDLAHLVALLRWCKDVGIEEVYVHAFLDGRDTSPTSATHYINAIEDEMAAMHCGRLATLSGRFWAMDRDQRWPRVEKAYQQMVAAFNLPVVEGRATEALERAYANDVTDEFVEPVCLIKEGRIADGDSLFFFNFRSDRAREISQAFFEPSFREFERPYCQLEHFVTMVPYKENFPMPALFAKAPIPNSLGDIIAQNNLKQCRIAETEKYAHVTFFFNGAVETVLEGESRILIPSPKEVETYDEKPEMSAVAVTDALIKQIEMDAHDVYILNFANADMVGHTGKYEAVLQALEVVDQCVGRVLTALEVKSGKCLIIADHGNADQMRAIGGQPHTAHTLNPVPCIYVGEDAQDFEIADGRLADVAPTLLTLLNLPIPTEMTGTPLLSRKKS